jgi:outer membrane protein
MGFVPFRNEITEAPCGEKGGVMNAKMMVIALIYLGFVVGGAHAAPALKIAYVDFQLAINKCENGKKAKQKLARWSQEKQDLLNEKQEELRKLQDEITKQSMMLKEETRIEKQQEYQLKLREVQRLFKDSQEEMRREELKLTRPIINDLSKIVDEIGKKEGYTFIFLKEQSGLLFANSNLDITQKIVDIYDARVKAQTK